MGEFYSSEEIVDTLQSIVDKKRYHQVRISGGESTIRKQHLIEI